MVEHPVPRAPQSGKPRPSTSAAAETPQFTPEQQQSIAHERGRICKMRGCQVCAPLRERRRLNKAQRKADAQAQAHTRGEPCGRSNCPVPTCVRARHADPAAPAAPHADATAADDLDSTLRRQAERHRAGLPCGTETCPSQVCVDGFAHERARRHRARRPCRSTACANPICVAGRSNT